MSTARVMGGEADIKRVGQSGQISVGKQLAGRYFREERLEDGSILLKPVTVLPGDHWTVRDREKILRGLAWASRTPPAESDLAALTPDVPRQRRKSRRGQ